jgi:hypothetical protein
MQTIIALLFCARQRTVLFGGTGQSLFGDTWEQFFRSPSVVAMRVRNPDRSPVRIHG